MVTWFRAEVKVHKLLPATGRRRARGSRVEDDAAPEDNARKVVETV